jgi:hypothetical protein
VIRTQWIIVNAGLGIWGQPAKVVVANPILGLTRVSGLEIIADERNLSTKNHARQP